MSAADDDSQARLEIPAARVRRAGSSLPAVWLVPLLAAVVAGYLVYNRVQDAGPTIQIMFKDGSGLVAGQTPIKFRGVPVGQVEALGLGKNLDHVLVTARLRGPAEAIARGGSEFWIVRPEVGVARITGLGTVITGPEIVVKPGRGAAMTEFVGLERPPPALESRVLHIVLQARRLGYLGANSPVYYRGVEVGAVQDARLNADGTRVDIHVYVQRRYVKLVTAASRFWDVSGVQIHFGLFRGLSVDLESVKALMAGGIVFATPTAAEPVRDGAVFTLHPGPRKEWLGWAPKLKLPPEE
jgi:paraquat-inducible protein B